MNSQPRTVIGLKYRLFLVALALAGMLLVLFATGHFGLGVTPDSVTYISVARNLLRGAGLVDYQGSQLVIFPPLYPALLAFVTALIGRDPLASARLVNAVLFGVIIYLSGVLFARQLASLRSYALLAAASVLVSVPLVPVVLAALSEPPFICLVLLFFCLLGDYLDRSTLRSLLLMALVAALACLTRYAGVILVAAGIVSILWLSPDGLRRRLEHSLILLGLSALPLGIWVARNLVLSRTFFGPRLLSGHSYAENAMASWNAILSWYLPARLWGSAPLLVALVVVILLVIVVASVDVRRAVLTWLRMTGPFIIFALLYAGFLLISSQSAFTQFIDSRYLSPIYVPLTIAILALAGALVRVPLPRASGKLPAAFLAVALALWLIYPVTITVKAVNAQLERGVGYASRGWRDSQTIRYLRDHPDLGSQCPLYSNGIDAIYWLTGIQAKSPPSRIIPSPDTGAVTALMGKWPPSGKACLVQFDNIDRSAAFFTTNELLTITSQQQVISFDDGAIYVLSEK